MSKKTLYKQCRLVKNGITEQTSWIPEEFAVNGKVIKIRENGVWDDGWVVESSGGQARTTEQIDQASRVHFASL